MFTGYFDPDKKTSASVKLIDAIDRYTAKHGQRPTVALLNPDDASTITVAPLGVEVRPARHVAPNTFFVGEDDAE